MKDNLPFPEETSQGLSLPGGNISKSELSETAKTYVTNAIEQGEVDIIEIYVKAKATIELMNEVAKAARFRAEDEVAAAGKEGVKVFGVKAEVASIPTKYSYDHDIGWQDRKEKLDQAKEELNAYQDAMKQAMKYEGVAMEGEIVEPAKVSGGGETIKVTIPKK
jgi:hypothetical protein